jgi:hypothetical protein
MFPFRNLLEVRRLNEPAAGTRESKAQKRFTYCYHAYIKRARSATVLRRNDCLGSGMVAIEAYDNGAFGPGVFEGVPPCCARRREASEGHIRCCAHRLILLQTVHGRVFFNFPLLPLQYGDGLAGGTANAPCAPRLAWQRVAVIRKKKRYYR